MSHSDSPVSYHSSLRIESVQAPGVSFEIAKVSLARRAEISRRIRGLLGELEYRSAGEGLEDKLAATELEAAIDRAYIEWGLLAVAGLTIDGEPATVRGVVERGPEGLAREIADAVRGQCQVSTEERKN